MSRRNALVVALALASFGGTLVAGQGALGVVEPMPRVVVQPGPAGAPRDPQMPTTRRIPIGTSAIAGTVTAAATGRPVAGARVMLSGIGGVLPDSAGRGLAGPMPSRGGGPGSGPLSLQRETVTDARGRFTFDALPMGQFTVTASATRFLATNAGVRGRPQPPMIVRLRDGERQSLEIKLQRGGVIEGTVYGLDGEPSASAQVRALMFSYASGVRRVQLGRTAVTDDRGIYRIYDLQPGEYVVSATPAPGDLMMLERAAASEAAFAAALAATSASASRESPVPFVVVEQPAQPAPGPVSGYAPTYAPSTPNASEAVRILIDPNTERTGVDVRTLPIRAGTVSGVVAGAPEGTRVMVNVVSDGPELEAGSRGTAAAADGTFSIANVPPGRYLVMAQTTPAPSPQVFTPGGPLRQVPPFEPKDRLWAQAQVTVDGPNTPKLAMALRSGRTISGTLILPPSRAGMLTQMNVILSRSAATATMPSYGGLPQAAVGADGRFTFEGVTPGSYVLRASGGPMKSAIVDGKDTLDEPLEFDGTKDVTGAVIALVERMATLSGVLSDAAGAGTGEYTVVLASTDKRHWTPGSRRVQASRPASDGRFGFGNLPAGTYLLAAVTAIENGAHYDPVFLEALSASAIRLTIADGGIHQQDIQAAR